MGHDVRGNSATTTWRSNLKVIGYCVIVGFAATAFGFDQGETGGFLAMQQWLKDFGYYDTTTQSHAIQAGSATLMYGLELGFVLIGSIIAGYIGSRWGRKVGLILCALTGLLGSALQMLAVWASQLIGRIFMGVSIGFAGNFAITYWSEVAPVRMRGVIVIFYQLFINVPNFIGSCVDEATYQMDNRWSYRAPLLTTMIMPLLLLALIWIVPESPRWLITRDRIADARASIRKIRGSTIPEAELDREIDEVVAFTQLEASFEASTSYLECFRGTDLRRTVIASLMMSGQQLMGIAFIAGYSTYFFALVGLKDAFVVTVIVNACQIAGPLVAFGLVQHVGRRPLLITGAAVNGICMLGFATVAEAAPNSKAAARCLTAFICVFCFSYAATWGSLGPVVLGEVPSNRLRSKTVSVALSISWVFCLAIICSIPYLLSPAYANLGTKLGFVFGALTVVVLIVTILILPETKDRSLEELDEMFINLPTDTGRCSAFPSGNSRQYVCTGQAGGINVEDAVTKETIVVNEVEKV